ncbi:MAG: MATE family efflux transporter [Eubacteriales bacterium]|nr:MATE family efflux transporter [Eubacteriales bacterium]
MYQKLRSRADRLLTSPVFSAGEIYSMAVPFVLDSLSIMFILALITALISSSGEDSVAAVNLANPIMTMVVCALNGISAGGTVAVTQALGTRDLVRVKEAAGHILWLIGLVGIALSLPLVLFPRQTLCLLFGQAEPAVLDKAVRYLQGAAVSLIIFTVYTAVFSILRGLGESKKCLYLTIIINVANLLFSVLFINVLRMDITGSCLALIAARLLGSVCALLFLLLPRDLPIRMDLRSLFTFRRPIFNTILHVSIPLGLEQIFLYGGNILVTGFLVQLGTAAVAVHAIANSIFGLVTAAASAAGNLSVTVVGRCIGANEKQWAYDYGKRMIVLGLLLLAAAMAVLYPLFPFMLTSLYHAAPDTGAQALGILHSILLPTLLFWPISNVMPSVLRAASDATFPSVLSFATMWLVRVGLGYVLAIRLSWGLDGVWFTLWAEWAVRTVILWAHFRKKHWLHLAVPADE